MSRVWATYSTSSVGEPEAVGAGTFWFGAGAGGVAYLAQQAVENPGPFMALVGKVLPLQVKSEATTTVETVVKLANLSDAELASMRSMLGKAGVQERDDRVLQ